MLQSTLLNKWWHNHQRYQGEVHVVKCSSAILESPEKYIDNLFSAYKNLTIEEVMHFIDADVTDNEMPNREVLEDGSKIHYLRQLIKDNKLKFLPALLHEPWKDRFRIHPGSGRYAALWLEGIKEFDAIYVHFNENNFEVPVTSTELYTVTDFKNAVSYNDDQPYFETYFAFPKTAKDCRNTLNMDREWQWHHSPTYIPWKFIRWSEGPDFLKYKKAWRSCGIDLWESLQ